MTTRAEYLGRKLDAMHAGNPHYDRTKFCDDNFIMGCAGEQAVGWLFGLDTEVIDGAKGDGGVDFTLNLVAQEDHRSVRLDVKTAKNPNFLIVEQGKLKADIYALCAYDVLTGIAVPLGWTWRENLARTTPSTYGGCVHAPVHSVPRRYLRPMGELVTRFVSGGVK